MHYQRDGMPKRMPLYASHGGRMWRLPRPVRIGLGGLLLVGGIIGLVLPFLQGILMIVAGLAILRQDIPWVARLCDHHLVPRWERWGAPWWERAKQWFRRGVWGRE